MNLLEQLLAHAGLVSALAILLGFALLGLSADIADALDEQQRGSGRLPRGARFVAAALAGTGLWWPLQLLNEGGTATPLSQLLGWGLALASAELVLNALRPRQGQGLPLRASLLLLALPLLSAHAALSLQGLHLHPLPTWQPLVVAGGLQLLGLALPLLPRGPLLTAQAGRAAGALLAALGPAAALFYLRPLQLDASAGPMPAQLGLAAAVLAALLLRGSLRQGLQHRPGGRTDAAVAKLIDPLTQLPTRIGIEQQLNLAALECDRSRGRLAVLVFDLDGFSPVNSSFGHDIGDALLRQAARRLSGCLGPHDVAGRIGGDDFVVLMKQAPGTEAIGDFAQLAMTELSRPYQIKDREISISCSVGIAQYPDNGGPTRMLACADAAKVAAKRLGGACHCFYTAGMDKDSREQLDLLRDLRRAVERKELELFYQPKVDAASGQITAAEALLRWRHPTRGLVSPVVFIPIAERFGFMRELGNWVIEDACRQAQVWREAGLRMRVAINLSAHQMRQQDLVARIESALSKHKIHPSLLTCEITESVAMEDTQATQDAFRSLGRLGVHLSIDDFGTGYSSLSYLRQLPASELKIDRASHVLCVD
eukprot:Opistho-2@5685